MKLTLATLTACLIAAGTLDHATAEPQQAKPSWAVRQRVKLQVEVRELRAENRVLRRQLAHNPSIKESLRLASVAYGIPYSTLHRRAKCESHLTARAVNPVSVSGEHATGLLQFLPSTFRSTPYANEDIFSPYANAMAAAWMIDVGRGGEWVCR